MSWVQVTRFNVYRDDWSLLRAARPEAGIAPLAGCQLTAGDGPELLSLPGRDHDEGVYRRRFARGDECFGLRHEGRLAALLWVVYANMVFGSYRLKLLRHEAYFLDLYVHPDYRGNGLAAVHYCRVAKALHERGFVRLFSITAADNQPALAFRRKLTSVQVDSACTIRVAERWRFGSKAPQRKLRRTLQG